MTPSKSMPKKSNYSFMEKYPYVRVLTLVSMHITDILTPVFLMRQCFGIQKKAHNDIEFCKEAKTIIVVDK